MIETILGSSSSEKVLIFLYARDEGYARDIARFFDTDLAPVQRQLARLEAGGVLVSRVVGRTRLFALNPRYPLIDEINALLGKTLEFYPKDLRDRLVMNRRRPRRTGKPL
jgi:hypothetical protein